MEKSIYGYIRVSTREQNEARRKESRRLRSGEYSLEILEGRCLKDLKKWRGDGGRKK